MKNDFLVKETIEKLLKGNHSITVYETTDSTNLRLKEEAKNNAPSGTVIIAENQTAGRGRLGRSFFSPSHSGIYMSLLVRPDEETNIGLLTAYTAVAVCEALEKVYNESIQSVENIAEEKHTSSGKGTTEEKHTSSVENISKAKSTPSWESEDGAISALPLKAESSKESFGIKWVNDIIKDGKKICGILAESGIENGNLEYIIVGIGINVYPPEGGFPDDIKNIAGSVFEEKTENGRNKIIAEIINRFYSFDENFISKYKAKSTVIGKEITVHKASCTQKAFALDIDDNCNLKVRYENGDVENLSFGEISIRPV